MVATPALDLDLLRTLIAIAEEGGFTRAGERVGRTQSAVSLQLQRLEALVGRTLVARGKGGGIELTPHGTALVERGPRCSRSTTTSAKLCRRSRRTPPCGSASTRAICVACPTSLRASRRRIHM